jgi:hypothetical protein
MIFKRVLSYHFNLPVERFLHNGGNAPFGLEAFE